MDEIPPRITGIWDVLVMGEPPLLVEKGEAAIGWTGLAVKPTYGVISL